MTHTDRAAGLAEENALLRARVAELERDAVAGREAQEALRLSEDKFSRAFHLSPDSININRLRDGLYIAVNQGFTDLTGFTAEEVIGRSSLEINIWHNPEDRARLVAGLTRQGEVVGMEASFRLKSGEVRTGLISARVLDIDGEPCILSVTRDIETRKQLEEALRQHSENLEELVDQRTAEIRAANARLLALSQVKDEFVSNVSHELRTPISSIKLYHSLLALNSRKFSEYHEKLGREIDRLNVLIEDLLRLSRLDQAQIEMELSSFDLNRCVAQYVDDRIPFAEAHHIALVCDCATTPLPVLGQRSMLEQALGVLLTNAIQYSRPGGEVQVRTLAHHQNGESRAGFSVSDSGPGISEQESVRLFERFYRGKVGRESQIPGTGLGLAIAYEIVQRHAGSIEVVNQGVNGPGATFVVWLPWHDSTAG